METHKFNLPTKQLRTIRRFFDIFVGIGLSGDFDTVIDEKAKVAREGNKFRIGIDIGGVIISKNGGDDDDGEGEIFFGDNWMQAPLEYQVVEVISELITSGIFNAEDVFLVSKCGNNFRQKTMQFLEAKNFFDSTGILKANVRFVAERHEKAGVCDELKITFFVDDSLTVLRHLIPVKSIHTRFHFNPSGPPSGGHYMNFSPLVKSVRGWSEILSFFRN